MNGTWVGQKCSNGGAWSKKIVIGKFLGRKGQVRLQRQWLTWKERSVGDYTTNVTSHTINKVNKERERLIDRIHRITLMECVWGYSFSLLFLGCGGLLSWLAGKGEWIYLRCARVRIWRALGRSVGSRWVDGPGCALNPEVVMSWRACLSFVAFSFSVGILSRASMEAMVARLAIGDLSLSLSRY